jgi:hypothetical protein
MNRRTTLNSSSASRSFPAVTFWPPSYPQILRSRCSSAPTIACYSVSTDTDQSFWVVPCPPMQDPVADWVAPHPRVSDSVAPDLLGLHPQVPAYWLSTRGIDIQSLEDEGKNKETGDDEHENRDRGIASRCQGCSSLLPPRRRTQLPGMAWNPGRCPFSSSVAADIASRRRTNSA